MKNLKKYILAILTCLCLMFTSLTGCALIVPDNTKALEEKAISVGSTVLTKQEVVDLWYSFYNENSSIFYYYSEENIVEIFYKNIICKYAMMQETKTLIADGKLEYTAGDDAQVWLSVLNYVASSVDTFEKALYTQQDKELPNRLQTESSSSTDSDVKSYLYTEYDFTGMDDYECKYTPENNKGDALNDTKVGKEVTDAQVKEIISFLSTYLTKTAVELEDGEELTFKNLEDLKSKVNDTNYYTTITGDTTNREKAFEMFVGRLMLTAKADGKNNSRETVLLNEIKRVYVSYYESYLTNMYTSYINSLITDSNSNYYSLNNQAIVARYLQLVGTDIQNYKLEENYIAVLEAKADETLLLYHFNGEYYYFTVQHLLVSFDDNLTEELAQIPGNESTASAEQYEFYEKARAEYYKELGLTSWKDYNNATYRDENGYDVYTYTDQENAEVLFVYYDNLYTLPDVAEDTAEEDKPTAYYYVDSSDNQTKVYLTQGEFDTCKKATVTLGEVVSIFNKTYEKTIDILNANYQSAPSQIKTILQADQDIAYTISEDLIYAYTNAKKTSNDLTGLNYKVYTNLFMQHAFKYSFDSASLGTDLSDYVGMVISGRPDNHKVGGSTYVSEFTNGARELANQYLTNKQNAGVNGEIASQITEDNFVISDYGIHIIVVNDVYKITQSAPITGSDFTAENIFGEGLTQEQIDAKIAEAVAEMKSIYVSSTSSQNLYEYMYELVRDELVGESGTVSTKEQNRLYNDYIKNDKAKFINQLSYDELMDAIS